MRFFRGHDLHADLKDMTGLALRFWYYRASFFPQTRSSYCMHLGLHQLPDSRLWNNRWQRCGKRRSSSNLGMSAAIAVSEATVYGGRACIQAMGFLLRATKPSSKAPMWRNWC